MTAKKVQYCVSYRRDDFGVQWYNSTIIFKDTPIQIENIITCYMQVENVVKNIRKTAWGNMWAEISAIVNLQ